jgi:hypothetical protein
MKRIEPIPRSDHIQVEFTAVQTPPKRLKERFPGAYSPHGEEGKTSQKMCGVPKKGQRKESQYWCSECEAALCLEESFKACHTLLKF